MKTALALLCAALVLVGCGAGSSGNEGDSSSSVNTLEIEAVPGPAHEYRENRFVASAGKIEIDFTNAPEPPSAPREVTGYLHGVVLEGPKGEPSGETGQIDDGSTSMTVDLKPGKYRFYCLNWPSEMQGTIKVVPGDEPGQS